METEVSEKTVQCKCTCPCEVCDPRRDPWYVLCGYLFMGVVSVALMLPTVLFICGYMFLEVL
jgi:hypothetical protein